MTTMTRRMSARMDADMEGGSVRALIRSKMLVVFGAIVGGVMAASEVAGGEGWGTALLSFAIVVGYSVVIVVLASRSETVSLLAGRPVDERYRSIHDRALAFAGQIGIAAALVLFAAAEIMHGDWGAYAAMAALMGIAYLVGVILYGRS